MYNKKKPKGSNQNRTVRLKGTKTLDKVIVFLEQANVRIIHI